MTDIAREKYERLMARIDGLEDRSDDLEAQLKEAAGGVETANSLRQELRDVQEELAKARSELSRISDGCGKPHPMN